MEEVKVLIQPSKSQSGYWLCGRRPVRRDDNSVQHWKTLGTSKKQVDRSKKWHLLKSLLKQKDKMDPGKFNLTKLRSKKNKNTKENCTSDFSEWHFPHWSLPPAQVSTGQTYNSSQRPGVGAGFNFRFNPEFIAVTTVVNVLHRHGNLRCTPNLLLSSSFHFFLLAATTSEPLHPAFDIFLQQRLTEALKPRTCCTYEIWK